MLHILGMGHFHPNTIIDNKFIEGLNVGTTEAWIMEKIGIEERRSVLPLDYIRDTRNQDPRVAPSVSSHTPTEMGVAAAKMALDRAGIDASKIGLVIANCCTPYQTTPSEGQRIAKALGCGGVAYDIFTACPVFALHIDYLNSMKEQRLPEYVLCVSTAALTQKVNYNDRTDGAIWGDGAAAWVVSAKHQGKLKVQHSEYTTDASRADAVVVDTYGYFHQDGRAVRGFSVLQTVRLIKQLEAKFQIDWQRDSFIGHQANATMLEQIVNNRDIPSHNHWTNVRHIGNQAGASAPAVLSMHWDQIKPHQNVIVAVVGAGLSWGSLLLEAA